ncbi:MAG: hypothetical protein ACREJD_16555 [Phycisphaerales bacterium]
MVHRSIVRPGCSGSLRPSTAAAAVLVMFAGHAAHAQSSWNNAGGGVWSNPLNWTPNNVPDSSGESALILLAGSYTVLVDNSFSIGSLTISNVLAHTDIANSFRLSTFGDIDASGDITINNTAGVSQTYMQVGSSQEWRGAGKVILNANPGNLDTAYIYFNGGGEVLTLASAKQIIGTGRVYVRFANNGSIAANMAGRTLELTSQNKTNNNEIAATNGGILVTTPITVNQSSGGLFRAFTGSTVQFNGSTINGGAVQTDAGGATLTNGTTTFNGLTTSGTISVQNGSTLRLGDSLVNGGNIVVNDGTSTNSTFVQVLNSLPLSGNGTLTLQSNGLNLDTAYLYYNGGGEVLTQSASHTIRGSGNVYVGIANNGTIDASTPGRVLRLTQITKTNNNLITASLGRLLVEDTTINQAPDGVISLSNLANASLTFRSSTVGGGSILCSGNTILFDATNTLNAATLSGPMLINNASELHFAQAATSQSDDLFVNTGVGLNNTFIRVMENHLLAGSGRIVLQATAANLDTSYIYYNGGGETLTQSAAHSIVGTGRVYVGLANAGLVSADQSGRVLEVTGPPKSNTGTMNALNGATLRLLNTGVTQTGAGTIRANGTSTLVQINGAGVNGGVVEGINGGVCEISGASTFNGVTFNGTGRVPNAQEFRISANTFTNNGVITINPTAGVNNTFLRVVESRTINGSGAIVLNADPANLNTSYILYNGGGEVLTQSASHSIRGTGNIYVAMVNEGNIKADVAGKTLNLLGVAKTNNALIRATSGGTLKVSNIGLSQGPNGSITADTGGKIVFDGATVTGGLVQSQSNSIADASLYTNTNNLSAVTLSGASAVPPGSELRVLSDGIVNNSILTVNTTGAATGTFVRIMASATIGGTGTILLNANPANFDSAYLLYNGGGEVLTLGPSQTLAGSGNIYVRTINTGILAPGEISGGDGIGRINLTAPTFTQAPSGLMKFDLAGPSAAEFDRITGTAALTLGGDLAAQLVNGYTPPLGATFDIIDGPAVSGTFATVSPGFTTEYFANKVRITYSGPTCPGDLNHDGLVDDLDFLIFIPAYNILDCADPSMPAGCPADQNRDHVVDDADFVIFVAQYNLVVCP